MSEVKVVKLKQMFQCGENINGPSAFKRDQDAVANKNEALQGIPGFQMQKICQLVAIILQLESNWCVLKVRLQILFI